MRPLIFLSLLLLSFIGITCIVNDCGQSDSPDIIRFGLAVAPVTLDPRFASDAAAVRINRLIYRGLAKFNDYAQPAPDLATWEKLSPTHYRFVLGASGRTFHNGMPLTTIDVKATFQFILDQKNASPHRDDLKNIKQISIIDDDTIDFWLTQPDSLFIGRMAGHQILPAPLIAADHPFSKEPIGSGAFRFISWKEGYLRLQRLEDKQVVVFLEIKDPVVRVLKLAREEVDILQNDLSPELIRWLQKQENIEITTQEGNNFAYIGFNLQDSTTQHLTLRKAIAYAIDREAIIEHLLSNAARRANSILPPSHWAGHPSLPLYPYDPQKAKRLLKQANFEQPISLVYKTSSNPARLRLAAVIQHQLAQVGINVTIRSYDWGSFFGDIKKGNFQMYSLMWVEIKMPDIFYYVFHSDSTPPHGANRGRFIDPQVDSLLEQAQKAMDLQVQAALYRQVQEIIWEKLPYVPLWYQDYVLATSPRISGYELANDGGYEALATTVIKSSSKMSKNTQL